MNWALRILCLSLFTVSAFAQQREVQVRLFSTQTLATVRVVARGAATLNGKAITSPVDLSIAGKSPAIQGKPVATVRFAGPLTIQSAGNPPVSLSHTLDVGVEGKSLKLVLTQPFEEYVLAVLAGEASNFKSIESLKAMAVAIRTYAVRFQGAHAAEGFDFCDTTHCQDFRTTAATDRLRAAVESTSGELLWYEGRPAATYYHQDCGGRTENPSAVWGSAREPYLIAQQDTFCISNGNAPWTTEITSEELNRAVGATNIEIVNRTPSGRVQRVRLSGEKPTLMSGEAFRLAIGRSLGWNRVRSDNYELQKIARGYRFQGRGSGHGVGLCQLGAAQMGEKGRSYRDILQFYYPGTKLGINAQGITWTRQSGERVDLQSTRPDSDRRVIAIAERLVRQAEQEVGLRFSSRPTIRVFPSVAIFRDSTGEPGWMAASTRGATIRLQPLETLGSELEKTLRHELLHVLVEQDAYPNLPLWFREGLVLELSDLAPVPAALRDPAAIERLLSQPRTRDDLQRGYNSAKALVGQLMATHGRATVLLWIRRGLPSNLGAGTLPNLPQR